MKKYEERNEESVGLKPTLKDAKDLEEKLKLFQPTVVNGRKQYPFHLFCEKEGYISFDQYGGIGVKNPLQYTRFLEINSLREWYNEKEMEHLFETFPEEKEAYQAKLEPIRQQIRALFKSFALKV